MIFHGFKDGAFSHHGFAVVKACIFRIRVFVSVFDVVRVLISNQDLTSLADGKLALQLVIEIGFSDVEVIQVIAGNNTGGFEQTIRSYFEIHGSVVFLEHVIFCCYCTVGSNAAKTFSVCAVAVIPIEIVISVRTGKFFDPVVTAFQRGNCVDTSILIGGEHSLSNYGKGSVFAKEVLAYIFVVCIVPDTIAGAAL